MCPLSHIDNHSVNAIRLETPCYYCFYSFADAPDLVMRYLLGLDANYLNSLNRVIKLCLGAIEGGSDD